MAQQQQQNQRQQHKSAEPPPPALSPAPSRSKGYARSARGSEEGGAGGSRASSSVPPRSLEVIRGTVRVSDGDTIELTTTTVDGGDKKEKVRLWGIDAPESKQTCTTSPSDGGKEYPCGDRATSRLRELFGVERGEAGGEETREDEAATVTCEVKARDQYGRAVARCFAGDVGDQELESIDGSDGDGERGAPVDAGLEMVESGNAVAYRQFSKGFYDAAERAAREGGRGIWAGTFEAPEDWRREQRIKALEGVQARRSPATGPLPPRAPPPRSAGPQPLGRERAGKQDVERPRREHEEGCDIKGNISGDGSRRYHVPSSASYDSVKIDTLRGERWFCSEDEAREAGWQKARDGGRPPSKQDGGGARSKQDGGGARSKQDGGVARSKPGGGVARSKQDGGGSPSPRGEEGAETEPADEAAVAAAGEERGDD